MKLDTVDGYLWIFHTNNRLTVQIVQTSGFWIFKKHKVKSTTVYDTTGYSSKMLEDGLHSELKEEAKNRMGFALDYILFKNFTKEGIQIVGII